MARSNEAMEELLLENEMAAWGFTADAHHLEMITTRAPGSALTAGQLDNQVYAFSWEHSMKSFYQLQCTEEYQPRNGLAWYGLAANDNFPIEQQLGYDNILALGLDGNIIPSQGPNLPMPQAPMPNTFLGQPLYPVAELFPDTFQNVVPVTADFSTNAFPAILPGALTIAPANLAPNVQHPGVGATFRQPAPEPRILCESPGCTKSFRRPGDFRRHMRKHRPANLKCIVDDCDMKFYRLDKVRDHIRQGHKIVL